jgi:hypothetical protein
MPRQLTIIRRIVSPTPIRCEGTNDGGGPIDVETWAKRHDANTGG